MNEHEPMSFTTFFEEPDEPTPPKAVGAFDATGRFAASARRGWRQSPRSRPAGPPATTTGRRAGMPFRLGRKSLAA